MNEQLITPSHLLFAYVVARPIIMLFKMITFSEEVSLTKESRQNFWLQLFMIIIVLVVLYPFESPLETIGIRVPIYTRILFSVMISGWIINLMPRSLHNSTVSRFLKWSKKNVSMIDGARWRWVILALVSATTQEILYRGFVMFYISKILQLEYIWAIIISSFLFGFCYSGFRGWRSVYFFTYFGALLALLYVSSGNIVVPILIHSFFIAIFWTPESWTEQV